MNLIFLTSLINIFILIDKILKYFLFENQSYNLKEFQNICITKKIVNKTNYL